MSSPFVRVHTGMEHFLFFFLGCACTPMEAPTQRVRQSRLGRLRPLALGLDGRGAQPLDYDEQPKLRPAKPAPVDRYPKGRDPDVRPGLGAAEAA
jgi:hypothetical protein